MRTRRTIAIVLATVLLLGFPLTGGTTEDYAPQYTKEADFFKSLGLIGARFDDAQVMTKASYCELLIHVMYPEADFSSVGGEIPFSDVPESTEFYSYIKVCKDLRIISGDEYNNFYPTKEITMMEMLTMTVNALGYTMHANALGTYPSGYNMIANRIGLMKGLSNTMSPVYSDMAVKMLYNALFADLVVITSVGVNSIDIAVDSTTNYLESHLGVFTYEGQVADNGLASIGAPSMGDPEKVVIGIIGGGFVTIYAGESGIGGSLGHRVKAYIKRNEETLRDEVVYFELLNSSKEILVNAKDIVIMNDGYLEYEQNKFSGRNIRINFTSGVPVVLFNGVILADYTMNALKPDDGFVRLVDADGDGRYEIIDITSFNYRGDINNKYPAWNIITDRVGSYISCRLNPSMNIDVSEDNAIVKFILNDNCKSLEDLDVGMVVSVAQCPELRDGKVVYFLVASDTVVDGVLQGADNANQSLYIGDKEYGVSSSLIHAKPDFLARLKIDVEATLYLDCTGNVAYSESEESGKNYAYLIKAIMDPGISGEIMAKVFIPDEGVKILPLRSNVIIDGAEKKTPADQLQALQLRPPELPALSGAPSASDYMSKPIILEVSALGYITRIDTENKNGNYPASAQAPTNIYVSHTPIGYSDAEAEDDSTLKAGLRTPRISDYSARVSTMDGKYFVTSKTMVINVPDIDPFGIEAYTSLYTTGSYTYKYDMLKLYENELIDENYKRLSAGSFSDTGRYDLQPYDIDPYTGVAGLLVVRGKADLLMNAPWTTDYPMSIFLRSAEYYDAETQTTGKVIYYTSDGSIELKVAAVTEQLVFYYRYLIEGCAPGDTAYGKRIDPLARGDVIRVMASGGKLTHIERISNFKDRCADVPISTWFPYGATGPYTTNQTGRNTGFPFYLSSYPVEISSTYVVGSAVAKDKRGSDMAIYTPKGGTVNGINPSDASTFSDSFIKLGGFPMIVVTKRANGDITVEKGSADDILTANQVGIANASRIIYWHSRLTYNQMLIFNDETSGGI